MIIKNLIFWLENLIMQYSTQKEDLARNCTTAEEKCQKAKRSSQKKSEARSGSIL